jgi:2-aminoadipate transaminase
LKSVTIHLDKKSGEPLYVQIYDEIRKLIMEGYYRHDERLPSIRVLCEQLGVNSITVVNAYKLLQNDGFAEMKAGSGTYVKKRELKIITASPDCISDELYTSEDIELMNKGIINIGAAVANFATTTPAPDIFPLKDFKDAIVKTIDSDGAKAFNYQESLGFGGLREIIRQKFFSENSGKDISNIQIISGAQQGIDIVAKALIGQNDCVVVERPTYIGANAVFESRGAKIIGVSIRSDGLDMEELASVMRKYRPKIIYTIPTYHNPTGYVYSMEKRQELLRLAKAFGSYIIEDDYLSELNYYESGSEIANVPLKKLDTNDCTIFVKSFSKLLMPGLRIGFMAVPDHLMEKVNSAKRATDISTSGLIQRAFYRYIKNGLWEKHLNEIKRVYKKRYELMLWHLNDMEEKHVEFEKPGGGFNFWVKLPTGLDANELYYQTAKKGVVFIPGSVFSYGKSSVSGNYARLSFAQANKEDIKYGMAILNDFIERFVKGPRHANGIYPLV